MSKEANHHGRVWLLLALMLAAGVFGWSRRHEAVNDPQGVQPAPVRSQQGPISSIPSGGGASSGATAPDGVARGTAGNLQGAGALSDAAGGTNARGDRKVEGGRATAKVATPGQNSTVRTIEAGVTTMRALRQAGYSQEKAAEIVARGMRESLARQYAAQGKPAPDVEIKGGGLIVREKRPE